MSINKYQISKLDKAINQLWDAAITTNDTAVVEGAKPKPQQRDVAELLEMSKKLDEIIFQLRDLVARQ